MDEQYMQRCLQLAELGAGHVAPNPMVGAVLVADGRVIGEGYHQQYGEPHAEVNCLLSVNEVDEQLIPISTLYVSLEPCAHFGKTPPCTDLIIKNKIPNVVIGCKDIFEAVNARLNDAVGQGKGIEKLKAAGVNVTLGVLEKECLALNKRFFTFHQQQRPYIILKWAQTGDGKIAAPSKPPPKGEAYEHSANDRLFISNEITNRLVHKWRSEEGSILVGTNTALLDDPALTTRLWPGKDPLRLVIDKELKLPKHLKLFDGSTPTIVFNYKKQEDGEMLSYHQLDKEKNILPQILSALYDQQIQAVMVEGGAKLLQSFIDEGLWDEARVICNEQLKIDNGLDAPVLKNNTLLTEQKIESDIIRQYVKSRDKNQQY